MQFSMIVLQLIRECLQHYIDKIDTGGCNVPLETQTNILHLLIDLDHPNEIMSKMATADYLGISRSTFDNRVHDGYLPKGKVQYGFKELSWNKIDLDLYKTQLGMK